MYSNVEVYFRGTYKENRGSLFTRSHVEKKKGNTYRLHKERFQFSLIKNFFTARAIIH